MSTVTRAIIFDLYFTLVRFDLDELDELFEHIRILLGLTPDEFARQLPMAYVRYESGDFTSFEEFLGQLAQASGAVLSKEAVAECATDWRAFQERALVVSPEVVDTLEALRARGYKLGLISNTMADVPPLWRASIISHLFDAVVFSCEYGVRKPAPEIYRCACDLLDAPPEACIFLGDGGGQELSGAERVGMSAIQLRWPDEPPGMAARLQREAWQGASITTLADLLPMLPDLNTPSRPGQAAPGSGPSSSHTKLRT